MQRKGVVEEAAKAGTDTLRNVENEGQVSGATMEEDERGSPSPRTSTTTSQGLHRLPHRTLRQTKYHRPTTRNCVPVNEFSRTHKTEERRAFRTLGSPSSTTYLNSYSYRLIWVSLFRITENKEAGQISIHQFSSKAKKLTF